jgi:hypothetical protein
MRILIELDQWRRLFEQYATYSIWLPIKNAGRNVGIACSIEIYGGKRVISRIRGQKCCGGSCSGHEYGGRYKQQILHEKLGVDRTG